MKLNLFFADSSTNVNMFSKFRIWTISHSRNGGRRGLRTSLGLSVQTTIWQTCSTHQTLWPSASGSVLLQSPVPWATLTVTEWFSWPRERGWICRRRNTCPCASGCSTSSTPTATRSGPACLTASAQSPAGPFRNWPAPLVVENGSPASSRWWLPR